MALALDPTNHDGSPAAPAPDAPREIGQVRSVSWTLLPRPGVATRMIAAAGPFLVGAVITLRLVAIAGAPILTPLLFVLAGVLASGAVLLHHVINAGPVTTWVGDDGVAIAARRFLSPGKVVRFSDVTAAEIITSHRYDTRDPRAETPPWLALMFRLQAKGAGGKDLLVLDDECLYREPGRPDDDDPATLGHLPHQHAYWFARALVAAWHRRAASRVSSPP